MLHPYNATSSDVTVISLLGFEGVEDVDEHHLVKIPPVPISVYDQNVLLKCVESVLTNSAIEKVLAILQSSSPDVIRESTFEVFSLTNVRSPGGTRKRVNDVFHEGILLQFTAATSLSSGLGRTLIFCDSLKKR